MTASEPIDAIVYQRVPIHHVLKTRVLTQSDVAVSPSPFCMADTYTTPDQEKFVASRRIQGGCTFVIPVCNAPYLRVMFEALNVQFRVDPECSPFLCVPTVAANEVLRHCLNPIVFFKLKFSKFYIGALWFILGL